MLTLLRRSRALALAMVLLAPGIAGTAVQWAALLPGRGAAAPHPSTSTTNSQAPQPGPQGCDCIGSCSAAVVVVPPEAAIVVAMVARPERRVVTTEPSFVPAASLTHLLPPATAPPLS